MDYSGRRRHYVVPVSLRVSLSVYACPIMYYLVLWCIMLLYKISMLPLSSHCNTSNLIVGTTWQTIKMTKTVWRAKTKIQTQLWNLKRKKISIYRSASLKINVSIFNSFVKVFKSLNSVYVHRYVLRFVKRSHLCPLWEKTLGLKETRPNWTR